MSDNLKTNNLHSVFKNDADGFFKKLLPKGEQFQVFKDCKDQIKAVIEIQVEKVYGVRPKFRLQGSWAYGVCNAPALPEQEMDFDYGCYLPESCFLEGQSAEVANKLFETVEECLDILCNDNGWELDKEHKNCIRIRGFMPQGQPKAHFDIPLYALPNEMFDDLTDASVKQDSSTFSKEEASYDSIQESRSFDFSEDVDPNNLSLFFNESTFSGTTLSANLSYSPSYDSMITEDSSKANAKNIKKRSKIKNVSLIQRDEDEWLVSDCEKVREWFLAECEKYPNTGQQLRAVIRYLKSWRDYNQYQKAPSSVSLMIIATEHYQYLQQRDDRALFEILLNLEHALKNDIKCKYIEGHSTEDFNRANNEQREENAELASELCSGFDRVLHKSQNENTCLNILESFFGERIPSNRPDLVTINVDTKASVATVVDNAPVQVAAESASIKPQIGG